MSSPTSTSKTQAPSRHARHCRLLLAFVWLVALPGCSPEQLQTFSEAMRAMNDDVRSTSPAYPVISQPVFQPGPAQWCIRIAGIPPVGRIFGAQLQNTCNETVHVTYGYRTTWPATPYPFPWCAPGQAGLWSGTATLAPWQSEPVGPLVHGRLDQVFWCACSNAHARAAVTEPAGPGVHDCGCRCVPR